MSESRANPALRLMDLFRERINGAVTLRHFKGVVAVAFQSTGGAFVWLVSEGTEHRIQQTAPSNFDAAIAMNAQAATAILGGRQPPNQSLCVRTGDLDLLGRWTAAVFGAGGQAQFRNPSAQMSHPIRPKVKVTLSPPPDADLRLVVDKAERVLEEVLARVEESPNGADRRSYVHAVLDALVDLKARTVGAHAFMDIIRINQLITEGNPAGPDILVVEASRAQEAAELLVGLLRHRADRDIKVRKTDLPKFGTAVLLTVDDEDEGLRFSRADVAWLRDAVASPIPSVYVHGHVYKPEIREQISNAERDLRQGSQA